MEWPIIRLYSDDRLLNGEWQNRGSTDIVRRWSQRQAHFIDEISGRFSSAQRKKAPHIIPHSTYTHFFRHFFFLIRILPHLIEIAAAELDIFYLVKSEEGDIGWSPTRHKVPSVGLVSSLIMFYTARAGSAEDLIILACLVLASKFDRSPHKAGRHNASYQPPPPATSHQPPPLYKRQCYHCVIHYCYVRSRIFLYYS